MITGPNGTTAPASPQEASMQAEIHSEAFLHRLMRDQLKLSISCAVAFLVALLGLPLLNYFYPEQMNKDVGGFTLTWLLLGVLFFPLVWVIAFVFIKRSIKMEEAEVNSVTSNTSSNRASP
jgi:uncharacterized membrane protein (DUF485 family)